MIEFLIISISCIIRNYDPSLESHLAVDGKLKLGFFYNDIVANLDEYKLMLNRVIQFTEDFEIITVNCSQYLSVCIDNYIELYPAVVLYPPKGSNSIQMSLEVSLYNIINFVTLRTKIKNHLPPSKVAEINRNNFSDFFYTGEYQVIEYFEKGDQASDMLDITYEEISYIYSKDDDIKFGRVNCKDDMDFCFEAGTYYAPILRIYHKNETSTFAGTREVPYILNFINEYCHKHRSMNGINKYQFSKYIEDIVKDFMKEPNKKNYISKMEGEIGGRPFSVMMNRILNEGPSAIQKTLDNLHLLAKDKNVMGESQVNVEEKIALLKLFQKYLPFVDKTEL